ncbi:MAG: sodium:solute symporter [Bacteroidetes bacterium GWF2_38_335]|nr:MAG: sodium:solute symporter [Bacteroidetes bacterium GWF2_38_335]OFY79912.1 MAG: sodium:solute symporter [Bacteroidetes bacterium RIFOXYA12_FULL_38_20]HBS86369.1 sodium:solute symporter [Bacteroidales bacterium]
MSPTGILILILSYFLLLIFISYMTSRKADNESFFIGNKKSRWYIVAFGMIGTSLSGVTFMSVPGWVGTTQFSYMMMAFGYFFGYIVIATVLMPLYYRMNLTSIYSYLGDRLGFWSYKTGAFFFILSRSLGASFRMYIVINVMQIFIFDAWNIPFWVTVLIFIFLVILYTYKGGVKTLIWTDSLQTAAMLSAVVLTIIYISRQMNMSIPDLIDQVRISEMSQMFFADDWNDKRHFLKQFFAGMFITITMTGLDQEMMQKNLSCRNIKEAKKNMFTFSAIIVVVIFLFLLLGSFLYIYASANNIPVPKSTDDLYPVLALHYLGPVVGIIFLIGLISAAFPSADGALTSLTTSFCIDFLRLNKKNLDEKSIKNTRYLVHFSFALLLLIIIVIFRQINDQAVIGGILTVAGYTYGPLLGLYSFGLFTKRSVKDVFVPAIAIISPVICYFLSKYSIDLFNGYELGYELLIINGILTFTGLWIVSKKPVIIEK